MIDPNQHDRFVLRQKVRLVINQYRFSVPHGEDDDGTVFCFVEQKRFKFKEDIRFFTGEDKQHELMRILARQRFDPKARYDVTAGGAKVGEIQKQFGRSLLRSSYLLFDARGAEVCTVQERNMAVAIFRRLVGFVPYVGNFADWLPIPYDFEFVRGEQRIGLNRRRRGKLVDVYDIDLSDDAGRLLDRRLALAVCVATDALQAR